MCNRLSCIALTDAAYGLPEEGWFRSMLFSVNTSTESYLTSTETRNLTGTQLRLQKKTK